MKGLSFCIIMFFVLTACNRDQPSLDFSELLSGDNLESTLFNISLDQDTLLKGKKGVEIYIPKGSFVENGQAPQGKIKIELKEATSKTDFIIANLTTITKEGQVLESNGMAYINATADGKALQLKEGANVQIVFTNVPYIEGMEVYYGAPNQKGQMTWEKEDQLVETDRVKAIKQGSKLYNENCSSCHSTSLRTNMTGPALGNVHLFRDKEWFVQHVRNSQKMLEEGDSLSICLFDTWNKSVMSSFEHLTEQEVESIYWWLKNESEDKKYNQ
ncbi:MAG: cytochrome c [Aureispira sp.]|nr:cytochrome c [Aureispira sp.]